MRRGVPLRMLAVAPMLIGAACEEPLAPSSGFDIWCGQTLCQWKVDSGGINKIQTWSEHDYGVQLLVDTRISRHLDFSNDKVRCIQFNLVANIDAGANVVLGLDFNDDGSTDYSQTLPSGSWVPLRYRITAPTYYNGVHIFIQAGKGGAQLAQLQELDSSDCSGAPVSTTGRPLGARCESDDQCMNGRCWPRTPDEQLTPTTNDSASLCKGCDADGDCGAGRVCGLVFSAEFRAPFRDCIPAGAHLFGQRCAGASECATGVCCGGMCSTCCNDGGPGCSDGEGCMKYGPGGGQCGCEGSPLRMPWRCERGSNSGGTGASCLDDGDCAWPLKCTGVLDEATCSTDGRMCASNADCPDGCSGWVLPGGQCQ